MPHHYKMTLVGVEKKNKKLFKDFKNVALIDSPVEKSKLVSLYKNTDCFLNLSYGEAGSLTNVESLSLGTPVVCYKNTGMIETIGDNCGYLIKTGDIDAVLEACKTIEKNGKHYYSLTCTSIFTEKI